MKPLNIFYEEPEEDRWFPFDRYPRRIVRKLVRGETQPGGHTRVFLNLCGGLDALGISYRVNNYNYIKRHPDEVACIIGKPHVLNRIDWENPILFGAAVFSHPADKPDVLDRYPIRKILVPGEWMRQMFEPYYGDQVVAWPVGIDTEEWSPAALQRKDIDILLYNKVRWENKHYETNLVAPIRDHLNRLGLTFLEMQYGFYKEEDFHSALARSKSMIFLCEHETQGIAYQQALSCGVPILAWDRGGYWQDPSYYPKKVEFTPVSSVPYWDKRCGLKFKDVEDFPLRISEFLDKFDSHTFSPREYILENLTLEKSAQHYLKIFNEVQLGVAA